MTDWKPFDERPDCPKLLLWLTWLRADSWSVVETSTYHPVGNLPGEYYDEFLDAVKKRGFAEWNKKCALPKHIFLEAMMMFDDGKREYTFIPAVDQVVREEKQKIQDKDKEKSEK